MNLQCQTGDVVNINLGSPPKEVVGHEQGLERPCIVVQSFPQLKLAIVIPCTSNKPNFSLFTVVKIPKDTADFTMDSYALCHQIRTISYQRIISKRGKLEQKDLFKIKAVLSDIICT